jgi:hypothetical protein
MDNPVYIKTEKGREEIQARKYALAPQRRTVLIMVDGRASHRQLAEKLASVADFEVAMRHLLEQGFIAVAAAAPAASPLAAGTGGGRKQALVSLATRLLGVHATKVVRKLQDTEDNDGALQASVVACCKLIKLTIDEDLAKRFEDEARKLA